MTRRLLLLLAAAAVASHAQAPYERLRDAAREPQQWLTYNGTYASTHHSTLKELQPDNVARLELKWVWQANSLEKLETTPLVVDGVMYLTDPPNDVAAIDARTGRVFWRYRHPLPAGVAPCCGRVNRGLAMLGKTLYMGTLDARLVAIDAATGRKRWDVAVANYEAGYSLTLAPLAIKDKIIVGPAGGELGIRGFVAAYDAESGREVWRFNTIPGPGEPGHETWKGDSWQHGGASVWLTGSYDPQLNLTYWGIGNPGPDWNPDLREGDNLYSDSVVALDADTGKLKWHFQFTPHDGFDFDAVQIPVLVDLTWQGKPRKAMLWGNRNGFFYVLDRSTGEFLLGRPFVKQTWTTGLDDRGRPVALKERMPSPEGSLTYPGVQGGTNWYAPSFSPITGLFYLTAWDDYPGVYYSWDQKYEAGKWFAGGSVRAELPSINRQEPRTISPEAGYGAIRALDPATGRRVWEYRMNDVSDSGLLTTANGLLFSGNREGHFFALSAGDGKLLWRRYLGGQVASSPITWAVDGRQYVSIASGHAIFTFGLPERDR
jgi:alcohol dehydrogenase (cytochrome c)